MILVWVQRLVAWGIVIFAFLIGIGAASQRSVGWLIATAMFGLLGVLVLLGSMRREQRVRLRRGLREQQFRSQFAAPIVVAVGVLLGFVFPGQPADSAPVVDTR